MQTTEVNRGVRQLVGFSIGGEEYGLDILRVREIIRLPATTRLPGCPTFARGIINLRGEVIPILSLAERFGMPGRDESEASRVIVVEAAGRPVGLLVDAVSEVLRVSTDSIEPPPLTIGGISQEYVTGVCTVGARLVILLDFDRILSSDEKVPLDGPSPVEETAGGRGIPVRAIR